ncbi:MAG: SLC13 family permease [bacterium]
MNNKKRLAGLIILSVIVGYANTIIGLDLRHSIIISVFTMSIMGTLLFWKLRLSFVFIGSGILLLINAVNLEDFIKFASLDVILFLIGMMILVGMMKEAGFFSWIIMAILRTKNLSGRKLLLLIMCISAFLTALMDEVTSIIIMVTIILDICDFLEIKPTPLILSSILATNIGSAATVLGNPIGILIAARGQLSFQDFIIYALPVSVIILAVTGGILLFIYRKYLHDISGKLKDISNNEFFLSLIRIPPDRKTKISMGIFGITILFIAFHHHIENLFGVDKNALLMILPIISAGIVMLYRHDKAQYYVEHEVEWDSLLFFMFLFIQAGVLQSSGVAAVLAEKIIQASGQGTNLLLGIILFSSGLLSSLLANVVVVASFIPIVKNFDLIYTNIQPFWWVLLFGACFGGNITVIGSTANIIAMGIYEKRVGSKISFLYWLKIGLLIGMVTMIISLLIVLLCPWYKV